MLCGKISILILSSDIQMWFLIVTIWHPGKGKHIEKVKRSVLVRGQWSRERHELAKHRGFLVQWNYFVWYYNGEYVSLYICPSPTECTPRVNSSINDELWMVRTCRCGSLDCNECSARVWDVDNGRGCVWGEAGRQGVYGNSWYFLLKFTVVQNCSKKNKVYF